MTFLLNQLFCRLLEMSCHHFFYDCKVDSGAPGIILAFIDKCTGWCWIKAFIYPVITQKNVPRVH